MMRKGCSARPLGCRSSEGEYTSDFSLSPSTLSPPHLDPCAHRLGQSGRSPSRVTSLAIKESSGASGVSGVSGILLSNLCGSKTRRSMETSDRSEPFDLPSHHSKFRMETVRALRRSVHQGDFTVSIVLSDAYLHVLMGLHSSDGCGGLFAPLADSVRDLQLSGRLPTETPRYCPTDKRSVSVPTTTRVPRIRSQQGEIIPSSIPVVYT